MAHFLATGMPNPTALPVSHATDLPKHKIIAVLSQSQEHTFLLLFLCILNSEKLFLNLLLGTMNWMAPEVLERPYPLISAD